MRKLFVAGKSSSGKVLDKIG